MSFLKRFEFCQKLFFSHNFGYRYASKSIKGSIDADFGLVFKKILSQKNWSMGWGPGEGGRWPKIRKHALIVTSPPENAKPKTNNFFFRCQREDLLNP